APRARCSEDIPRDPTPKGPIGELCFGLQLGEVLALGQLMQVHRCSISGDDVDLPPQGFDARKFEASLYVLLRLPLEPRRTREAIKRLIQAGDERLILDGRLVLVRSTPHHNTRCNKERDQLSEKHF